MAITFSEQFRAQLGGRKWIMGQVTHDESAVTLSANVLDVQYIDYLQYAPSYFASDMANTSALAACFGASVNATHDTITFDAAVATGSKGNLTIIGW